MTSGFGIKETIQRIFWYVYTKIFWKNARLIRLPIQVRNKKNITYSKGFTVGIGCRINVSNKGELLIGRNVVMGDYNQIEVMERVEIGDDVLMASRIYIGDSSHGVYAGKNQCSPKISPNERKIYTQSVRIGSNVWIGNGVSILAGVDIGDGCVIGANTVVTRSVPSNCIVVGNPGRVIKKYNFELENWEIIRGM